MSVINTNIQAIAAARNLNRNQELLGRSLNRLSSGSKIVNAADDAGGLAVSEKLDGQSLRISAASTNVQNAISYIQSADGYMGGMSKILSRMSELATMSQDVTKNSSDRDLYEQEFSALQDQLRSTIGGTTTEIGGATGVASPTGQFNGTQLFGPTSGVTVGIGAAAGQSITIPNVDLRSGAMLSLIQQDSSGAYTLHSDDTNALDVIGNTVQQVATDRATLGGVQSRLGLTAATLQVQAENLSSTISRIRDVDVAQESTQMAKYNILVQSGTAMLVQANQAPASVLKLLQQ